MASSRPSSNDPTTLISSGTTLPSPRWKSSRALCTDVGSARSASKEASAAASQPGATYSRNERPSDVVRSQPSIDAARSERKV